MIVAGNHKKGCLPKHQEVAVDKTARKEVDMKNFLRNTAAFAAKAARAIIACLTIITLCICTAPARAIAWALRTVNRPFEFVRAKYAHAKDKLKTWGLSQQKVESEADASDATEDVLDDVFTEEPKPAKPHRVRKAILWVTLLCVIASITVAYASRDDEVPTPSGAPSAPSYTPSGVYVPTTVDTEVDEEGEAVYFYTVVAVHHDHVVVNDGVSNFNVVPVGITFDEALFKTLIGERVTVETEPSYKKFSYIGVYLYEEDQTTLYQEEWLKSGVAQLNSNEAFLHHADLVAAAEVAAN
jgi:hypothetical protein